MTDLPDGWSSAPLGEVCTVVSGATPKTANSALWGGEVAWITPDDLSKDHSQTVFGGRRTLTGAGLASCSARLFPAGSVIFSSRAPIGYVAIAGVEMATNQGCKTAVPPESIASNYLYWHLVWSTPEIESRASGTTFREISGKRFAETMLRWPPIDEQRRIVEILEDHLSRLDAADAYLDACLRRTAQVLRSAIHAQFDNLVEPLRPLPAVATIINGHTPKGLADAVRSAPLPGDIAFFKVGDMNQADGDSLHASRTYVGALDISRLGLRLAAAGTIVFPKRGGAIATNKKRTLAVDGAFDLNTMGVAPGPDVSSAYLRLFFETVDLLALADGSNVPQINTPDVASLHLPVPDLTTQERMTSAVREVGDALRRLEREVRTAGTRSGSLRRALLHAAFSGCLTGHTSDADTIEALAATPSPPGRLR